MKTLLKLLFLSLFLTFAGCTEENYYYENPTEKLGRVNIYIEGDLTNAQVAEKLDKELGTQTENIYMERTSLVTDIVIDARISENLRKIIFADSNTGLKNITITGKGSIRTLSVSSSYHNSVINIKGFKEIDIVQFFTVSDENLNNTTNILVEDLETVNSQLTIYGSEQTGNYISLPHLKTVKDVNQQKNYWRGKWDNLNLPELIEIANIYTSSYDNFTAVPNFEKGLTINELYLPKLIKMGVFYSEWNTGVYRINLPLLEDCYAIRYESKPASTNPILYHDQILNIPLLKKCIGFTLIFNNLHSQAVNLYLHKFLTITPNSGKYITLIGDPPTGQGLTDKQILIDNNNQVYTN